MQKVLEKLNSCYLRSLLMCQKLNIPVMLKHNVMGNMFSGFPTYLY